MTKSMSDSFFAPVSRLYLTPSNGVLLRVATASVAITVLLPNVAQAVPFSLTAETNFYEQKFTALPLTGSASLLTTNGFDAWFINNANGNTTGAVISPNVVADAGTTAGNSTNAFYSYGLSGSADRALGSINVNATGDIRYGLTFTNSTGRTLSGFRVEYTGEQWRYDNGATALQTLQVDYNVGSSNGNGVFTNVSALTFTNPISTGSTRALDGNATANQSALNANVTTTSLIANEGNFQVRFNDLNGGGNDHGMGIDDLKITALYAFRALTFATAGDTSWAFNTPIWNVTGSTTPVNFIDTDNVTFSLPQTATVSIDDFVRPDGVVVSASSGTYTFDGEGLIYGDGGLSKSGNGLLVINTENEFTGNTVISGGSIEVGTPKALQKSVVSVKPAGGGSLSFASTVTAATFAGLSDSGPILLANANNAAVTLTLGGTNTDAVHAGSISGAGAIVKVGTGTQALNGVNTFAGGTTISGGRLLINNDAALGQVPSTLSPNVMLDGGLLAFSADATLAVTRGVKLTAGKSSGFDTGAQTVNIPNALVGGTASTLVKAGTGTLVLTGANDLADVEIQGGTLVAASASALTSTGKINFTTGNGTIRFRENYTLAAGRVVESLAGGVTGTFEVDSGRRVTVAGSIATDGTASSVFEKTGAGTLDVIGESKNMSGTLRLSGGNTLLNHSARQTSVDLLHYTDANNFITAPALDLAGGNLELLGATAAAVPASQTFVGTSISPGASQVKASQVGGGSVINMGVFTRATNGGGTVDFVLPSSANSLTNGVTTTSTNTGGIIGGWATVGQQTWATVVGSGTPRNLSGLPSSSYAATSSSSATNLDVAGTVTSTIANSVRFNSPTAASLNSSSTRTITSGGILVTAAVGTAQSSISGTGFVTSSGPDIIVHQHNPSSPFTISSRIGNNDAKSLTKSGAGILISSGSNNYQGRTFVNAGTLVMDGTTSSQTSIATISQGGTLKGSGTFSRPVVVNPGGTISAGSIKAGGILPTVGMLTTNSQTWNGGGALEVKVQNRSASGLSRDNDYQKILGSLAVVATDRKFVIRLLSLADNNTAGAATGFTAGLSRTFTIVEYTGPAVSPAAFELDTTGFSTNLTGPGQGNFALLFSGTTDAARFISISYQDSPEPATAALCLLGGGVLLTRRPRGNKARAMA